MKQGWEFRRLGDLFDVKSSKRVHQADWKSSGIPFYRAREVVKLAKDGSVINELFISEELYNEFIREKGAPKAGDIIISAVGTLGQCYLVKEADKFYFKDASVLWLENISKVDSRYIEFSFMSNQIMAQVMEGSMGATVGTLTISRAKDIQIPLPPLQEQQRIVAILDEAFAAIAQAKANAEQNLQNAKELFESYLQSVFENKGDDWELCNLETYIKLIDYRGRTPVKTENGVRLITAKNVKLGYLQLEPQEFIAENNYENWMTRGIPNFGDVIFTTEAPLANVAQIDSNDKVAFAQRIIVMQPEPSKLNQTFLKYMLLSNPIRNKILGKGTGATVLGIKSSLLKKIEIYFPNTITEQKTIVQKLDALSTETKQLEAIYQQKINDLDELKKSILQKAFAGELNTSALELEV